MTPSVMTLTSLARHGQAPVLSLLSSCRSLVNLHQIHALIIKEGLEQDHVVATRFLCLCNSSSSSSAVYASQAFDRVASPNIYLWNTLLKVISDRSSLHHAIPLFNRMMKYGSDVRPDSFTFPPLLKSCANEMALREGAAVHGSSFRFGVVEDLFVRTGLIDMYGKCSEIRLARELFDTMANRNEVSWTAMIVGHLSSGDLSSARSLFDEMPVRNVATWNAMIDGYVKKRDLGTAHMLFDRMPQRSAASFTLLMDGYLKTGDIGSARLLFDRLNDKDLFSWSTMISGYVQNGQPSEAVEIFQEMWYKNIRLDEYILVGLMSACSKLGNLELAKSVDSYVTLNQVNLQCAHVVAALIDMNAKCGNLERAAVLFESLPKRDMIAYCSMMQGYSIHGFGAKAVQLFSQMLHEGFIPDEMAFTVVLTACRHVGLIEEAYRFFELMKNEYLIAPSSNHYAIVVDLLGRGRRLKEAYELVRQMPMEPHASAWGALLGACKLHGDIVLGEIVARRLFELEPHIGGSYVLLSNIYAESNRWTDVSDVRSMMKEMGIKKTPGYSWI